MAKFKCRVTGLSRDFATGKNVITLMTEENPLPALGELVDMDLSCEIGKYKKPRSLNANSYLWVLLTKQEIELSKNDAKIEKDDLYRSYIRHFGKSEEYEIPNEPIPTIVEGWERSGLGWFADLVDEGINRSIVRFYYGSSSYNTEEMKRLIDAVVTDCKALGIETKTPDQIAELLARWGENNE